MLAITFAVLALLLERFILGVTASDGDFSIHQRITE